MKFTELDADNITNEFIEEIFFKIPPKEYSEADCIIIFGCHMKALLDERLKLAIEILSTKKVNKILLTGGVGVYGDFNEAEYMKEYLLNNGVKEENILIENKSTTTEENIIKDEELKLRVSNEIKKIIRFIEAGIIEDEDIKSLNYKD